MNAIAPHPFADLDDSDFLNVATKASTAQRFDCPECAGTGRYQGARRHQVKSHCFACRGLGYFKTDPRKLAQRKAAAKAKKADAFQAFHDANADVIREIGKAGDWSDFARSLSNQLQERKPWSANQLAAAQRMAAKLIARREQRAAERKVVEAAPVELGRIKTMFDAAHASGYKRPTYRAEGVILSRAPDHGANAGALYVKAAETGDYLGKVVGDAFRPVRGGEAALPLLQAIAADPLGAAVRYGQKTGTCSCCGRTLTNHASIEAGIGPVCRQRFGL